MINSEDQEPKGPTLKPYTVMLSDEQIAAVRQLAATLDRKQSAMLRRLVVIGLDVYHTENRGNE